MTDFDECLEDFAVLSALSGRWLGAGPAEAVDRLNSTSGEFRYFSNLYPTRLSPAGGGRIEAAERITAAPYRKICRMSAGYRQEVCRKWAGKSSGNRLDFGRKLAGKSIGNRQDVGRKSAGKSAGNRQDVGRKSAGIPAGNLAGNFEAK